MQLSITLLTTSIIIRHFLQRGGPFLEMVLKVIQNFEKNNLTVIGKDPGMVMEYATIIFIEGISRDSVQDMNIKLGLLP